MHTDRWTYAGSVERSVARLLATAAVLLLIVTASALASEGPYPGGPSATQIGPVDVAGGIWLRNHFDFRLEGEGDAGDDPFTSVDSAGDWNNDGIGDYVVGQWDHGSGGKACIIFGKKAYLEKEHVNLGSLRSGRDKVCMSGAESGDDLGSAVAGGFDVGGPRAANAQPISDVVIGGVDIGGSAQGGAYVVYGQDCKQSCAAPVLAVGDNDYGDWTRYIGNDTNGGDAGAAVAMTPDMNGDSFAEVIVGDPDQDQKPTTNCNSYRKLNCGTVWVIFGGPAGGGGGAIKQRAAFRIDGANSEGSDCSTYDIDVCVYGQAGQSVGGGGDINGDGRGDIVVGAPEDNVDENGAAYVVFGKSTPDTVVLKTYGEGAGPERGFRIRGSSSGDADFGYTVSIAPDMNRDGRDEAVVADPRYGDDRGAAYVVFGKPGDSSVDVRNSGNWGFSVVGANNDDGDYLGAGGLAGVDDFNGDGRGDIIVGGPGSDETSPKTDQADWVTEEDYGAVWIIYGQGVGGQIDLAAWTDKSKFVRIEGESGATDLDLVAGDEFGGNYDEYGDYYTHMIAGADINGDGHPDILGSAPWWDSADNNNHSAVYTFLASGISYGLAYYHRGDEIGPGVFNLPCGREATIAPTQITGFAGANNDITVSVPRPLPEGLSLDPKSGVIAGTPTVTSQVKIYDVTLTNNYTTAKADASLAIGVQASPECPEESSAAVEPSGESESAKPSGSDSASPSGFDHSAGSSPSTAGSDLTANQPSDQGSKITPHCASSLKLTSSRAVALARRLRIRLQGPRQLRSGSGSAQAVYRITTSGKNNRARLRRLVRLVKFTLAGQRLTSDALQPFTATVRNDLDPGSYRLKATVLGRGKAKRRVLALKIRVVRSCR